MKVLGEEQVLVGEHDSDGVKFQEIRHVIYIAADPDHETQEEIIRGIRESGWRAGFLWGSLLTSLVACVAIWWRG